MMAAKGLVPVKGADQLAMLAQLAALVLSVAENMCDLSKQDPYQLEDGTVIDYTNLGFACEKIEAALRVASAKNSCISRLSCLARACSVSTRSISLRIDSRRALRVWSLVISSYVSTPRIRRLEPARASDATRTCEARSRNVGRLLTSWS